MNLIRCLHITNARESIHQMGRVGVDATGIKLMKGKSLHFNLKVEGINPRTANLLKQEMLSLGGDAALDGRGLDCSAERTDAILMGTEKLFEKLVPKLVQYPDLHPIGQSLGGDPEEYMQDPLCHSLEKGESALGEANSADGSPECYAGLLF